MIFNILVTDIYNIFSPDGEYITIYKRDGDIFTFQINIKHAIFINDINGGLLWRWGAAVIINIYI